MGAIMMQVCPSEDHNNRWFLMQVKEELDFALTNFGPARVDTP
jgi:hypothetical protein